MNASMFSQDLLGNLDPDKIDQAIDLVKSYKGRFAYLARAIMDHAEEHGIDEGIARTVIAGECLLLAAYMYMDDHDERESFVKLAGSAFDLAFRNMTAKVQ